jgi:hypothetical protein
MKKLVLLSVAMFAISLCAATNTSTSTNTGTTTNTGSSKIDFCTGYVKGDLTSMTTKTHDSSLDQCVKNRYTDMTTVVSNVLNKTCSNVKNAVSTYCKTGKATGSYKTETFTYNGKTYNNALVLYHTTTKCTAKTDTTTTTTGTHINNPGERWFFASDECSTVNF